MSHYLADEGEIKLMLKLYQYELGNNICSGFLKEKSWKLLRISPEPDLQP